MAGTKKRRPDPATVKRWISQGCGQGCGHSYKPGLYVRDVPSEGLSHMTHSRHTGREHHYFSSLEHRLHLLAEYNLQTLDIREQFALLPWDLTQSIATRLGLKHPRYVGTRTPLLMTTDMVLTVREPDGKRHVAIAVKPSNALCPRTLEKLFIEQAYWQEHGIEWVLATDRDLMTNRSANLLFFEPSIQKTAGVLDPKLAAAVARQFEAEHSPQAAYQAILARTATALSLDGDLAHKLLGLSVWTRVSRIDIDACQLAHEAPVPLKPEGASR